MSGLAQGLRPGGKAWLVVPTVARGSRGEVANHWYRKAKRDLYEELRRLVEEERLAAAALHDFVVPTNERGLDEWEAWFASHRAAWRLEFARVRELPNPYLMAWQEHRDDQRFGREYLSSIRAWGERIVDSLISHAEAREEVFTRLSRRFAERPTEYADDNLSLYLGVTRL
jgi:hypothetical protein